jgi:hypothetical protein
MYQWSLQYRLTALIVVGIFLTGSFAAAENAVMGTDTRTAEPSAEVMMIDMAFMRPLGLVSTVVGAVAFVVSLPITIPAKQVNQAARTLVVTPAEFTFTRHLGDVPDSR